LNLEEWEEAELGLGPCERGTVECGLMWLVRTGAEASVSDCDVMGISQGRNS